MPNRDLRKYSDMEVQKEINDRKTIQEKYRRYNNVLFMVSTFITVSMIAAIVLLFDYQVLRPQDNRSNDYFTEKTAIVSIELATLLNCDIESEDHLELFTDMNERLLENGISMFVLHEDSRITFASKDLHKTKLDDDLAYELELLRERYFIERHRLPDSRYTVYFLVPKSDAQLMKKSFWMFLVTIFAIASIFRWGSSHTIMKRVYKNMVEPLDKIKHATNQIRNGNYDDPLKPEIHYNKELKATFRDFEKMREQLKENKILAQQYEANRKELISNISHDLKTPISSVIGYVEGILDGVANTPAKHDRYMQIIYKKSLDLNRLVNDLILFSKLDVNKVSFQFKTYNLQTYMETLFEEFGIELRENNIELVSRYQARENLNFAFDAQQLRRVFNNIVGNAMKHLNKDIKAIEILVYEELDEVIVRISDNGAGIPKDKVDQIFDRFYKGDLSRNTDVGSSGLGLSISKQIVLAHGGRIWATSDVGEGTIIYFTLKEVQNG